MNTADSAAKQERKFNSAYQGRTAAHIAFPLGGIGSRYDAIDRKLYLKPQQSGDFSVFISTATGFGRTGIRNNRPFINTVEGQVQVEDFELSIDG